MNPSLANSRIAWYEDVLDFLETLPEMIERLSAEGGTIHFLPDAMDVLRSGDDLPVSLTGASLVLYLVFQRTGFETKFESGEEGREAITLLVPKL